MTSDPADRRQQRQQDWSSLLLALYRRSGGDPFQHTFGDHLAEDLGWPPDRVHAVAHDLVERGYVEIVSMGPMYVLSPDGADAVEDAIIQADPSDLTDQVTSIQTDRTRTLREVYRASAGSTMAMVPAADLETTLGLERQRLYAILKWLSDRSLIQYWSMSSVGITQDGLDSIEVARDKPEEPALSGLSAFNNIEVTNSPGAMVMAVQGSPGANVSFIVQRGGDRLEELRALLVRLRDELELDEEAEAALEAVQKQSDMGRSDSPIIHGGLAELRAFAAAVGANAIGGLIVNFLAGAPPF